MYTYIGSDTFIINTVEPPTYWDNIINSAVLSFIERLSSFRGSKCTKTIGHVILGPQSVLCRGLLYVVPISEGPLSEVPLYTHTQRQNYRVYFR